MSQESVLVNDNRIAYVNDDQEEYSSLSLSDRDGQQDCQIL